MIVQEDNNSTHDQSSGGTLEDEFRQRHEYVMEQAEKALKQQKESTERLRNYVESEYTEKVLPRKKQLEETEESIKSKKRSIFAGDIPLESNKDKLDKYQYNNKNKDPDYSEKKDREEGRKKAEQSKIAAQKKYQIKQLAQSNLRIMTELVLKREDILNEELKTKEREIEEAEDAIYRINGAIRSERSHLEEEKKIINRQRNEKSVNEIRSEINKLQSINLKNVHKYNFQINKNRGTIIKLRSAVGKLKQELRKVERIRLEMQKARFTDDPVSDLARYEYEINKLGLHTPNLRLSSGMLTFWKSTE